METNVGNGNERACTAGMNNRHGPVLTPLPLAISPRMERTGSSSATEEGGSYPAATEIAGGMEGAREAGRAMAERSPAETWARELLSAVDTGSAPELMDLLAAIIRVEPAVLGMERRERERMELLQGIALQMRLDLHGMLIHIYQRLEASRTYLDVVRHLAGESLAQPEPAPVDEAHILKWPASTMPSRKGPKRDSRLSGTPAAST